MYKDRNSRTPLKQEDPPDIPPPLVLLAVHALYSTPLPYVIAALVVPSGGLTLKFCFFRGGTRQHTDIGSSTCKCRHSIIHIRSEMQPHSFDDG